MVSDGNGRHSQIMKAITTPTDHISSASENGRPKIISGDLNVEDKCYIVH